MFRDLTWRLWGLETAHKGDEVLGVHTNVMRGLRSHKKVKEVWERNNIMRFSDTPFNLMRFGDLLYIMKVLDLSLRIWGFETTQDNYDFFETSHKDHKVLRVHKKVTRVSDLPPKLWDFQTLQNGYKNMKVLLFFGGNDRFF